MEFPTTGEVIKGNEMWSWKGEDGVVRTKAIKGAAIEIEHARRNTESVTTIFKQHDGPYLLLVDVTDLKSISREAREHYSSYQDAVGISAFALITGSPLSKILANFFLAIQKQTVPCRTFNSEEAGVKWIKNYE